MMENGQEIEKFKVRFDATNIAQEDDVNEKMDDIKGKGRKSKH